MSLLLGCFQMGIAAEVEYQTIEDLKHALDKRDEERWSPIPRSTIFRCMVDQDIMTESEQRVTNLSVPSRQICRNTVNNDNGHLMHQSNETPIPVRPSFRVGQMEPMPKGHFICFNDARIAGIIRGNRHSILWEIHPRVQTIQQYIHFKDMAPMEEPMEANLIAAISQGLDHIVPYYPHLCLGIYATRSNLDAQNRLCMALGQNVRCGNLETFPYVFRLCVVDANFSGVLIIAWLRKRNPLSRSVEVKVDIQREPAASQSPKEPDLDQLHYIPTPMKRHSSLLRRRE
ncbi:hypothetical protein MAP00_007389 [Monascus purpureus]|nr:hypothetical protein MAP00_007389 [Monascus purpureus]